MGIQFAVHTYGYHDAMFYVLNGIKMIMNSDFSSAMIKLIATVATSYYAIAGMAGAARGAVGHFFMKTLGMVFVVNALLMPKADMLVVDRVTGQKEIVRGLPYAFVLPVGTLEAFGAGITSLFEQAFAPVSSTPYKDYGLIFGQRIVQEFRNARITNPEFARNMDKFIDRCVVLEAMIGTRITPEEIKLSDDLFTLVTDNAGTFRKVDFRVGGRQARYTCKEAGKVLKDYLKEEMKYISIKYKNNEYALAGSGGIGLVQGEEVEARLNHILATNIEVGYSNTFGINKSAEEILRQNIMVNSMKDFNNKSDLYGYTRATSIQNANSSILREIAERYLPILLNIMKALIYASFIFIVPLMILSGGMTRYLNYCTVVFSLQIWPALSSILNLFIELYSNAHGSALVSGAITYGNYNEAYNLVDNIVSIASGLQIFIPWLSFTIVQGSVSSFVHLASSMGANISGAASIAANEATTRNFSMDNQSLGNSQIANQQGFKTDWNQQFQEGARQLQRADGSIQKEFASGNNAVLSGGGINTSQASRKFALDGSIQATSQEGLSNTLTALSSDEQHYNEAKNATIANFSDFVSQAAQKTSAGESLNYEALAENGQALQQAVNRTNELMKTGKYTWETASLQASKEYAEGKIGTPAILGVGASIGRSEENSTTKTKTKGGSLDETSRSTSTNDTNTIFNNMVKAGQNKNWLKEQGFDESLADKISGSYSKMQDYQSSISTKRELADTYREAIDYTKHSGAVDSRDMTHEVENMIIAQNPEIKTRSQAHDLIESNDPRAGKAWNSIVDSNMSDVMTKVRAARGNIEAQSAENAVSFKNIYENKVNHSALGEIQSIAQSKGLDTKTVESDLKASEGNLRSQHSEMRRGNREKYAQASAENKKVQKQTQEEYNNG